MFNIHTFMMSCIGGILVLMFTSNVADIGFQSGSCQTKNYKIGICCFSAKHIVLRWRSKEWLALNQDVSEWQVYPQFQWASTLNIQLIMLVKYKVDIISWNVTCSRHDIAENCSFGIKQQ